MTQFKAMKFRVRDEEHSKAIQTWLFEQGYRWPTTGQHLHNFDVRVIHTWEDGGITYSDDESFKRDVSEEEMTLDYTTEMKYIITNVKPMKKRNIVNVGGVDYYEDELAEALSKIKPVEGNNYGST